MLASIAFDCLILEFRSGKTKDQKIGIIVLFLPQAHNSKNKCWLARNHDYVSEGATCLPVDCSFYEFTL